MAKKKNNKKNFLDNNKLMAPIILILYFLWIMFAGGVELTILNFIIHTLFLAIIVILEKNDLKRCFKEFKQKPIKNLLIVLLFAVLIFVVAQIGNIIISLVIENPDANSGNVALSTIFETKPWGTIYVTFLTVLFYPIIEESVFRGSFYSIISRGWLYIALSVSVACYLQIVTINPSFEELIFVVPTMLTSLFSAIIYTKKKNLLYVILPRIVYNLVITLIRLSIV